MLVFHNKIIEAAKESFSRNQSYKIPLTTPCDALQRLNQRCQYGIILRRHLEHDAQHRQSVALLHSLAQGTVRGLEVNQVQLDGEPWS